MTLLKQYVNAVRMYLPKGPQQDDILSELSEHLQSKMDEEEEALGRPLTEVEQEALLTQHGNPAMVAARYGAPRRSVAFGWQLIGPELFPLYFRILLLNWATTLIVVPLIREFGQIIPRLGFWPFAGPMLAQLVIVTLVFTSVDWFQRVAHRPSARASLPNWRFPPSYLQCIPRWQSLAGVMLFGVTSIWWVLVPTKPVLMLGPASTSLEFSSSTTSLYWVALALLLISTAQRATTLVRPDWNWLQALTRLITNGSALVLLYPFAQSFPYVMVSAAAADPAKAAILALRVNSTIWWLAMGTMSIYWLINVAYHLWVCAQFLLYAGRRRAEQFS